MKYTTGMPARRAWRASRRLNSGKSISTMARGRDSRSRLTRSVYARARAGTRLRASLVPTAACAVGSTRISTPAAAMRDPPMPTSRMDGSRSRMARHMVAPWRSPDASPADSMMGRRSAAVIDGHHGDPGRVRGSHRLLPIHEQHLSRVDGQSRRAPVRHGGDGRGPDGGNVEAEVVSGRDGLDDDGAGAGEPDAPSYRLVGAFDGLDGQRHPA